MVDIDSAAAHAAANSLITRSLRLLQEQCAETPLVAVPEERQSQPCTAVAAAAAPPAAETATTDATCATASPRQADATMGSLACTLSAPATAGQPSKTAPAAASISPRAQAELPPPELPPLQVRMVPLPPVSPADGTTPRSALTTAFTLLRTSSDELRAEAAAMAEAVAAAFAAQQAATLAALGLAAPEAASQPATPLPTPVS